MASKTPAKLPPARAAAKVPAARSRARPAAAAKPAQAGHAPAGHTHAGTCQDCGVLTRNQQIVFDAIARSDKPIGAYGVMADLSAKGTRVLPPTVYRALEGLTAANLVHRLESLNAYVACTDHDHTHDSLFVICADCGRTQEFADRDATRSLAAHAAAMGFAVQRQMIELRGRCGDCARRLG